MPDVEVKAPSNVKFSGEHSVVYGGPSLSAAIELYATAKVEDVASNTIDIILKDLGLSISLDAGTLRALYDDYSKRDTKTSEDLIKYIYKNQAIGINLLPYATIASRLLYGYGIKVLGKRVVITSEVPMQKGQASSAICSTSFATALIASSGKKIDDQIAIDIARDGERVIHKVETAGRMDVGPAYFGGYVTFSSSEGVRREEIATKVSVVVFDVGPKPSTAEMVKKVRDLYNKDITGTTKILREMDDCVLRCIESLKRNDLKELGKQMSRNHALLKNLGVSSERMDNAVSIALSNGAYGAKLCGGGGGGIGMALAGSSSEATKIAKELKNSGIEAYEARIAMKGARDSVKRGKI